MRRSPQAITTIAASHTGRPKLGMTAGGISDPLDLLIPSQWCWVSKTRASAKHYVCAGFWCHLGGKLPDSHRTAHYESGIPGAQNGIHAH